ncbi:hypothetical protein AJ79_07415 [Helicocarpus griseus UAMH5409]|uniref:Nephrocystin 3-like N-terminal domain-containing protein n=1 Tax=Helicocarpus griseus UAMH5409 TaxID=1447875 RepID=A0A2B7X2Y7_9EURO|nr:hypothetical protein AJ79_07415 [Helicocarpus griseus UAMH5409]
MEAVSAAAAIAGLATLAGQSSKLIIQLVALCHDCSHIFGDVETLCENLRSLQITIKDVENNTAELEEFLPDAKDQVQRLRGELVRCVSDLSKWLAEAEKLADDSRRGLQRWTRKLKGALKKNRIQQINDDVASHRDQIGLMMSVFACHLGVRSARGVEVLSSGISGLTVAQRNTEATVVQQLDTIPSKTQDIPSVQNERREKISQWLSAVSYADQHAAIKSTRLDGTGLWLLNHPDFRDWRDTHGSEILWLHGDPGSGKTNLISAVIDSFEKSTHFRSSLFYFYCCGDHAQQEQTKTVLRSIIRQFFWSMGSPNPAEELYDKRKNDGFARDDFDIEELVSLMQQFLVLFAQRPSTGRVFIAIDGLDECDSPSRHQLIQAMHSLVADPAVHAKFIVGSRNDTEIYLRLGSCRNISIKPKDTRFDITRFIVSKVDQAISERRLLRGNVTHQLRNDVISQLVNRSDGMFLWARLQIEAICGAKQVHDLEAALKDLPVGLTASYESLFCQIRSQRPNNFKLASRAFQWILYGCAEIDAPSIMGALSLGLDNEPTEQVDIDLVIDVCYNLVGYDPFRNTFALIHETAKKFLLEKYLEQPSLTYITRICVAALHKRDPVLMKFPDGENSDGFLYHAATHWPEYNNKLKQRTPQLRWEQYELMTDAGAHSFWIQRLNKLPPPHHLRCDHKSQNSMDYFMEILSSVEITTKDHGPLLTAAYYGLCDIGLSLINCEKRRFRANPGPALHVAAQRGHIGFVSLLLRSGIIHANWVTAKRHISALHRAAESGHSSIVQLLLSCAGNDVNVTTSLGMTPLLYAINSGQQHTALLLLKHPFLDVNMEGADSKRSERANALFLASARRLYPVVKALLKFPEIKVNQRFTTLEQTSLIYAASRNYCELVRLLLTHGQVDPNASDTTGNTALHFSVLNNCELCCRTLLASPNINPNIHNHHGDAPISLALKTQQTAAASTLLHFHSSINMNITDSSGNTPLIIAAQMNHEQYAIYLLNHPKFDINATNMYQTTALHWALVNKNCVIAETIISRSLKTDSEYQTAPRTTSFDVNQQNNLGSTYIGLAAVAGLNDMLAKLLSLDGVKLDLVDEYGFTALDWAIRFNRPECAKLLQNAARVSQQEMLEQWPSSAVDMDDEIMLL